MDGSIPADAENVTEDAPEETPPAEGETGEEENPETEEGESTETEEGTETGNTPKTIYRLKGQPSTGYSSLTRRNFPAAILQPISPTY